MNISKRYYHLHTVTIPAYTTAFCTISAFLIGLWRLPSRMSTVKYILGGLGTGIVISYVQWRYSLMEYYGKINGLFRIVIKERYQQEGARGNISGNMNSNDKDMGNIATESKIWGITEERWSIYIDVFRQLEIILI